jgi:hypothetical protein
LLSIWSVRPSFAPAARRLDEVNEVPPAVTAEARSETQAQPEPERPPALLTVISPLEGEELERGSTVAIRWAAHPSVQLGLVTVRLSNGEVLAQNVLDKDRLYWRVTSRASSEHYVIRVETEAQVDGEPLSLVATSPPFAIVNPSRGLFEPEKHTRPVPKTAAASARPLLVDVAGGMQGMVVVGGLVCVMALFFMGIYSIRSAIGSRGQERERQGARAAASVTATSP